MDNREVISYLRLDLRRELAYYRTGLGKLLEYLCGISELFNKLKIPFASLNIYELTCSCIGVFLLFNSCELIVKKVRYHKEIGRLCKSLGSFLFNSHKLIYGIEYLLLYTRSRIEIVCRDDLVDLLVHSLCSGVTVAHGIADDITVLIEKRKINAPCVYAKKFGLFAYFSTLCNSLYNVVKKGLKIPAFLSVLVYGTIGKTVNLFKLHLSVLNGTENMSSA